MHVHASRIYDKGTLVATKALLSLFCWIYGGFFLGGGGGGGKKIKVRRFGAHGDIWWSQQQHRQIRIQRSFFCQRPLGVL